MYFFEGPFISLCGTLILILLPCYAIYDLIKKYTEQKRIEKKKKARKEAIDKMMDEYRKEHPPLSL
jgi:predicted membrane protein